MKRLQGWTLLELLLSVWLSSMLAVGIFFYMGHIKKQYSRQYEQIEMIQKAESILDFLGQDLQKLKFFAQWTGVPLHKTIHIDDPQRLLSALCTNYSSEDFLFLIYGGEQNLRCSVQSSFISFIRLIPIISFDPEHFYVCIKKESLFFLTYEYRSQCAKSHQMWRWIYHLYYVDDDRLKRKVLQSDRRIRSESLFDGVEQLFLWYGLDLDNDHVVDRYVTATNVPQNIWVQQINQLKSIQIQIILRSPEMVPIKRTQKIRKLDGSFLTFDDQYKRLSTSRLIVLENQ